MDKIMSTHRARGAYIYIRQSTPGQVVHNVESTRRQYSLQERAHALGWEEVHIIDDDLGRSGGGHIDRHGFETLVAAICQGQVGAIFATEASRLARNGHEWHRLLEFCAIVDTLLIDHDGVYDPKHPNDRLLLGLKGTLSELESVTLRQRSQEAIRQKARRGAYYATIPAGYVRRSDGGLEKDPDEQVRASLELVFGKFRELGSARQVCLWCRQEGVVVPRKAWDHRGAFVELVVPTPSLILSILHHPIYAGAYTFGRTRRRTILVEGRKRQITEPRHHPAEWAVFIPHHHEGYITWEAYEANQETLRHNQNQRGETVQGAARQGKGLLSGLVRCGHCGKKMRVRYSGRAHRQSAVVYYLCTSAPPQGVTKQLCSIFGGVTVEDAVVQAFLATLGPDGMERMLRATERLEAQRQQEQRQREFELERARYEADRCQRQYSAVDPAHRLVARTLESRWNQALERVAELEEAMQAAQQPSYSVSALERTELQHLAVDLPRLWEHPAAPFELKKRLLRTVIKELVVYVESSTLRVIVHWQGGQHTELSLRKRRNGEHRWTTDQSTTELIRALARQMSDKQIAAQLNRMGRKSAKDHTWTRIRVGNFRKAHNIANYQPGERQARGELTIEDVAARLGVSYMTVLRMIQRQALAATQVCPGAPWLIAEEACHAVSRRHATTLGAAETPLPLFAK
jgi:excisionase family DNA binding protein